MDSVQQKQNELQMHVTTWFNLKSPSYWKTLVLKPCMCRTIPLLHVTRTCRSRPYPLRTPPTGQTTEQFKQVLPQNGRWQQEGAGGRRYKTGLHPRGVGSRGLLYSHLLNWIFIFWTLFRGVFHNKEEKERREERNLKQVWKLMSFCWRRKLTGRGSRVEGFFSCFFYVFNGLSTPSLPLVLMLLEGAHALAETDRLTTVLIAVSQADMASDLRKASVLAAGLHLVLLPRGHIFISCFFMGKVLLIGC